MGDGERIQSGDFSSLTLFVLFARVLCALCGSSNKVVVNTVTDLQITSCSVHNIWLRYEETYSNSVSHK